MEGRGRSLVRSLCIPTGMQVKLEVNHAQEHNPGSSSGSIHIQHTSRIQTLQCLILIHALPV